MEIRPLILASASQRRIELLGKLKVKFTVEAADIDERLDKGKELKTELCHLAYRKAQAVLVKHPEALVIGADTLVVKDGELLGKPQNQADAVRMLRKLAGSTHEVLTAVALISKESSESFLSVSAVTFYPMSEQEIADYVAGGEPMDKAGAYGIQGDGGKYIKQINGDYYAIMGLPLAAVYQYLKKLNYIQR